MSPSAFSAKVGGPVEQRRDARVAIVSDLLQVFGIRHVRRLRLIADGIVPGRRNSLAQA